MSTDINQINHQNHKITTMTCDSEGKCKKEVMRITELIKVEKRLLEGKLV